MTLSASSNDPPIHSLTNVESKSVDDSKTTGATDLNNTRNDDQQAIVVKQEENQRSSEDTNNKAIAASLEIDENMHQQETQHSDMVVVIKSDALDRKDDIIRMVESEGFIITRQREIQLTTSQACKLFKEESNQVIESTIKGSVYAMVLQKNDADVIQDWQRFMKSRSDINTTDENNIPYRNVTHSSQTLEQAKKDVELLFHDDCVTQHENNADDSIDKQPHNNMNQSQPLSEDMDKNNVSPSTECITTLNDADLNVSNQEKKDVSVNASPCLNTGKLQEAQIDATVEPAATEIVTQYSLEHKNATESMKKKEGHSIMTDSMNENKVEVQDAEPHISKETITHLPFATNHKEQPKTQPISKQQSSSNDDSTINTPNVVHKRAKMPRVINQKQIIEPDNIPLSIAKKKASTTKGRLARLMAPTISSSRKNVAAYQMGSMDTQTGSQTATIAIKSARPRISSPRK